MMVPNGLYNKAFSQVAAVGILTQTLIGIGLFLVYVAYLCIYRLYFSPLAQFPGPRIAGACYSSDIYYKRV